jgi:hypothetical protein
MSHLQRQLFSGSSLIVLYDNDDNAKWNKIEWHQYWEESLEIKEFSSF